MEMADLLARSLANARACERILGRPLTDAEYVSVSQFVAKCFSKQTKGGKRK